MDHLASNISLDYFQILKYYKYFLAYKTYADVMLGRFITDSMSKFIWRKKKKNLVKGLVPGGNALKKGKIILKKHLDKNGVGNKTFFFC